MKKLNFLAVGLLLLIVLGGCRRSESERFQQNMENLTDSAFEFIEQPADSVVEAEAEASAEGAGWADDDGLVAVPDIPKERAINMNADDYETKKVMTGR